MIVETPEVVEALKEVSAGLKIANAIALATNMGENITDIQASGRVLRQLSLVERGVLEYDGY